MEAAAEDAQEQEQQQQKAAILHEQEADLKHLFGRLFDRDDRRATREAAAEDLAELLRVEGALPPSPWLPWVPQVRGRAVGELQAHLDCLLWLAKKARLGQDAFLLAPPGCDSRLLAFQFCAMAGKDAMYLRLSRDTTESDLKQRREIRGGSVVFTNQPPVEAALHGRVLVIEGIEKAERNVLPLLNNLLENREMQLEDGSFLLAPHKQHLLKQAQGPESARLRPVKPSFFVIAIGLPVPRYRGMPLDPPLRSRFAAFSVEPPSPNDEWYELKQLAPAISDEDLTQLLRAAHRVRRGPVQLADSVPHLPRLAEEGLRSVAKLRELFPQLPLGEALHRAYPHRLMRLDEGKRQTLAAALGQLVGGGSPGYARAEFDELLPPGPAFVGDGVFRQWEVPPRGLAMLRFGMQRVAALCGGEEVADGDAFEGLLASQREALVAILQDHCTSVDLCLVGERGVGKTLLARRFAQLLGYTRFTTFCFQDMTARELTARRSTDANGDTTWQWSPLVEAASQGELAVLDGVHRLPPGSLAATVGRLVSDRELDLPDGTRLVCWDHWQALRLHYSTDELKSMKIGLVHPSFRILCTAEPPTAGRSWLDEELLTLFHFVHLPPPASAEYAELLARSSSQPVPQKHIQGLHSLASALQAKAEEEPQLFQPITFSTRRILQVGKYLGSQRDLGRAVAMTLGAPVRFLPQAAQDVVRKLLTEAEFKGLPRVPVVAGPGELSSGALQLAQSAPKRNRGELQRQAAAAVEPGEQVQSLEIRSTDKEVWIGDVCAPKAAASRPELVPHDRFVDIPRHVELLQRLLLDFTLGQHALLIGNQGVGKNKIADRLLALLGREREYVQLHRDTTVASLVLTPTLVGGSIVWEDSPLVRAVRHGRVLMVDEADKAPLEVVCVLKSLVDDGELSLPDGRRIAATASADGKVVEMHEGFRIIVLANRPGFPFLGNDFYRECGDVFASLVVDNPDMRSEAQLLSSYGPSVPRAQIAEVLALFATLREQVERGRLNYPYSAREAVKIVEHLERFPSDSLERACRDVFAFDVQNATALQVLVEALSQHSLRPNPAGGDGATEAAVSAVAGAAPPEEGRRRGLSPVRAGRVLPLLAQAEAWGLRRGAGQCWGSFGCSTAVPFAAVAGFGVTLGGPVKGELQDAALLPPELLEVSERSQFQKELVTLVNTALDFD